MQKRWMQVVWPAFLAAAVMEMVVFALFDPHDLRGIGRNLAVSSEGIYTLTFFAFWAITTMSSWLTTRLAMSASDLNSPDSLR